MLQSQSGYRYPTGQWRSDAARGSYGGRPGELGSGPYGRSTRGNVRDVVTPGSMRRYNSGQHTLDPWERSAHLARLPPDVLGLGREPLDEGLRARSVGRLEAVASDRPDLTGGKDRNAGEPARHPHPAWGFHHPTPSFPSHGVRHVAVSDVMAAHRPDVMRTGDRHRANSDAAGVARRVDQAPSAAIPVLGEQLQSTRA